MKLKTRSKLFRKCLIRNKIFFEVFSYVFLGLASIYVASLSYMSSEKQLEITTLQSEPLINIQKDYNDNYEFIKVSNVGYHLTGVSIDYTSFLIFKNYETIEGYRDFYLKTADYYNNHYEPDNTTGIISSISSSKYMNVEKNRIFDEIKDSILTDFDYSSFKHLLKIRYYDIFKKTHVNYYSIDSFNTIEIEQKKYDSLIGIIENQSFKGHYYLNELNVNEIKEFIEINISKKNLILN